MEESIPLPKRGKVSPSRYSESRLVRRAASGDTAAFAEIFERHGQELYRYCRAILGDPDDAQDALQNTMDRVLRALPGEERTIYLRPWLFRVARNESISLIRSRSDTVELTDASAPAEPAADVRAEHRAAVRTLVSDLASLPESQRSALVLHELNGLSHDEISHALQRSPRASRQAIYEARLALQELREGRSMECDEVRIAISDGDGRVVRGRKIRSHLRDCRRCSDFERGIERRRAQFGMLAPPLPAAAAAGLIASVLGGGSAAGGLAGAGAGTAGILTGSVALKSVGIVAASLALGAGGASIAGVDVPLLSSSGGSQHSEESLEGIGTSGGGSEAGAAAGADGSGADDRGRSERSERGSESQGKKDAKAERRGSKSEEKAENPKSEPPAHSNAGGNSGSAPGPPEHSNAGGNAGVSTGPPPQSNAGGNSSGGTSTGPPPQSNAGGNSDAAGEPPAHSNAGGNSEKEK